MQRHWLMFLIGANLIVAVLIASIIHLVQTPAVQPVLMAIPSPSPLPSPTPPPEPKYNSKIHVSTDHWYSWALLDKHESVFIGSDNWAEPNYLMSMIKPWIAADYLASHQEPSAATIDRLATMIVDSNNEVANDLFGGQASWDRLIQNCGLIDLQARAWSWSTTGMSARDAARYGNCIYSGASGAGPRWTPWIIDQMRHVRGLGDFGPRVLFGERSLVATKNGWEPYQGQWYINCLAMADNWSIAILQRWPNTGQGYEQAIKEAELVCNSVASQVLKLS